MRYKTVGFVALAAVLVTAAAVVRGQGGAEVFKGTATVKAAGGAAAAAPVVITVARKMSQDEADKVLAAFKDGGAPGLRKALAGAASTGTVQMGNGEPTPTCITIERPTAEGRLLTIVADRPILFLGAGLPNAKPKEGYDFAFVDLVIDQGGQGMGTIAPAAKIKLNDQGALVVEDYSGELVKVKVVAGRKES